MDYDRLRELQEKFDENPRRYFAPLANEYRKGGQPKRAIEICRTHLAQMPGHMSGQIVFGQALFEAGEWAEARTVFERALTLDPENLIALRSLGDMALQAGNTAEARSWYGRLLEADPKDVAVLALVSEIDASPVAATPPPPEEIPEPAAESPTLQTVEAGTESEAAPSAEPESVIEAASPSESMVADEIPAAVEARSSDGEAPAGLERHYPVESVEEQEPVALAESMEEPEPVEEPSLAQMSEEPEPIPATPEPTVAREETTFTGASAEPFVNETMAQLYLQQGYRQLALKVYRQLAASRPYDQALRDRIAEIEAADAADHPEEAPAMRREEPSIERPTEPAQPRSPSIESPTPWSQPGFEESPGFDRSPIDSPPPAPPSRQRESIESPERDEPHAEPEGVAARQPSVREFFATLGRRRPPRASGNPARRSGNNLSPDA
ncbi:MAG TPA: tetratricopeptide repeat protein, partial [Gemmatimonadaceae bacterium]|nr:tetratricopeptide repeat protein [Gemmatimonadaceae bacterium]